VVFGEDEEPIAVLLRDAINDEPGYQAVVVPDGKDIEDAVRERHTDLLILDIMMPGLSGFEIYDRLRAHSGTQRMPVLFISAAVDHYAEDLLRRGITEVVAKPFDLNELLDRVRALCPPAI
jgi:DNA-binding response OmpR family regulator